jgi:hypothetical protein
MVLFKKIRKTSKYDKKFEIWKFLHLTKYAIHSTLITTYEVEESSYSGNIQAIITSDELFR